MGKNITANDLKTKGVSAIAKAVSEGEEAIITVRGKDTYVVVPIEKYNYYRVCELDAAIMETKKDLNEGNYVKESVEDHLKRITCGKDNIY